MQIRLKIYLILMLLALSLANHDYYKIHNEESKLNPILMKVDNITKMASFLYKDQSTEFKWSDTFMINQDDDNQYWITYDNSKYAMPISHSIFLEFTRNITSLILEED
jgi:hypothetical protein